MKLEFLHTHPGTSRLILIFAGWGMSPRPLEGVTMPGYDVAVVWDYRDLTAAWIGEISGYDEIAVTAWSFGVHAAARFMNRHPDLNITARIAVNGTRFTADDTRGIPRNIFDATLAGLTDRSVTKFNMRMCGGAAAYKDFALRVPGRDAGQLRDELAAFDTAEAPYMLWDKAFISTDDLIIPPANQARVWDSEAVQTFNIPGPHLPDFNSLLRLSLTDKSRVEQRFRKAETTYNDNAPAQYASASRLLDLVTARCAGAVDSFLEIGCGTGRLTEMALTRLVPSHATLWDLHISPQIDILCSLRKDDIDISAKDCDAETEIRGIKDGTYSLILSASTVQWFNSLRTFLVHASHALRRGGIIALSTYGPATMSEIHRTLHTTSRFPSIDRIRRMIPTALEIVDLIEEIQVTRFDTPFEVLRHMSRTGVNGLTSPGDGSNTAAVNRLLRDYPLDNEGKAPLTYNPIYIILRKL